MSRPRWFFFRSNGGRQGAPRNDKKYQETTGFIKVFDVSRAHFWALAGWPSRVPNGKNINERKNKST